MFDSVNDYFWLSSVSIDLEIELEYDARKISSIGLWVVCKILLKFYHNYHWIIIVLEIELSDFTAGRLVWE